MPAFDRLVGAQHNVKLATLHTTDENNKKILMFLDSKKGFTAIFFENQRLLFSLTNFLRKNSIATFILFTYTFTAIKRHAR